MDKKDDRIKISSEILNAIKYVKMLGQEKFFLSKVITIIFLGLLKTKGD